MPRRTNEFQKLVYLIRQQVSGPAVVTESKMLTDRITHSPVEVDICIEGSVGGEAVVISIECTSIARRADKNWVNLMKAKHERLPTDRLVLVSRSGFSKDALKVAQSYGIKTVSLGEADNNDLPQLLVAINDLWAKSVTITVEKITCHLIKQESSDEETLRASPDNVVYSVAKAEIGEVKDIVQFIIKSEYMRNYILENATNDHKWFEAGLNIAEALPETPIFLQKISETSFWKIKNIHIAGPCEFKTAKFSLQKGRLGDVTIALGKTEIFGQSTIFVATRDQAGRVRNSLAPMLLEKAG